jgi:tRNA threonylcarbamoyladenosine biosynthesis protein TsaB
MPAPHVLQPPVLALDTSTDHIAAALSAGGQLHTASAPGGPRASAALMPLIQSLLERGGTRLQDLAFVAFGRGPGAFTGLRTACAVAQGLGLGLDRPLLPLDSLLIVAEDARLQHGAAPEPLDVAVLMDARMDEAYACRYRWQAGQWQPLQEPGLYALDTLQAAWASLPPHVLAGSGLDAFSDRLLWPADWPRYPQEQDRAGALLQLAMRAAAAGVGVDAADALPLYLRDKVAFTTAERDAQRLNKLLAAQHLDKPEL